VNVVFQSACLPSHFTVVHIFFCNLKISKKLLRLYGSGLFHTWKQQFRMTECT